jgi:Uma2 family endonuclease
MMNSPRITPEDLIKMPDEGIGFELIDGQLRERNKSVLTSLTTGAILSELMRASKRLGWTVSSGVGFQCFPNDDQRVRRADVAFTHLNRWTTEQALSAGHCTVVPDLVVEVVAPNELADDLNQRLLDWLEAGAELVWVIHPVRQSIHAYRPNGDVRLFQRTDVLTAEPVLPDFRVPVAELFKLPVAST